MSSIKQGYKQTKVGIIPEDWDVVNFDELKDKTDKHSITGGPFGSDLKSEHYTTSGVRVIQLQNIGDGKFINKEFVYTSEEKANQLKNCLIYPNEIILAKMAEPVARACLIPLFEDKFLMCSDGIRLLVDKNRFSTKYVLEYINYDLFRKIAIDRSTGSTRGRIGLSDLKTIPLALPPLKEQEKIAEILTTWDEAISLHVRLIKEKEQLKIGLMQKLLSGEVRFEGFCDVWEEVKLEDIGQIITGTTPSTEIKEYYENGHFPWITPTDINHKKNISTSERYLTSLGLEKGRFIPKGSLLVTCIASIGKNAILTVDGSCNQQINAILPSKKNNINYLYYLIEYKKDYLIKFAGQSATQILNKKSFSNLKIKLPSLHEQQKIAEVLSLTDDELNLLKKELEVLKQQQKGLMQKLLTGEVRVMA